MSIIGEKLRKERERQGLDLRDIEQATSIRLRYLQAIEDGEYSVLPGEVYAKGFIRNYAAALGFNGPEFVSMYKEEITQTQPQLPAVNIKLATPASILEKDTEPVPKNLTGKNKTVTKKLNLARVLFISLLVVTAAGSAIYFLIDFLADKSTAVVEKPSVTVNKPVNTGKNAPPSLPVEKKEAAFRLERDNGIINIIPADGMKIDVINVAGTMTAACWTQVWADEREIYKGMMRDGEKFSWQAQNTLWLKFGDANAVNMTVNGQPVQKLGEAGQVVESTITILQ